MNHKGIRVALHNAFWFSPKGQRFFHLHPSSLVQQQKYIYKRESTRLYAHCFQPIFSITDPRCTGTVIPAEFMGTRAKLSLVLLPFNIIIMSESLSSCNMTDKGLDQSTMALTISSISIHESENVFEYDEEFTLNPAPKEQVVRDRKNCLAMRIAETFPKRIKQEVMKIVDYYESSVEENYRQYHRLVQENARIKRENQKMRAQAASNELMAQYRFPSSCRKTLEPIEVNTPVPSPDQNLKLRVHELQNKVISRDRKINELNSELSDLMIKLKKYRKKGDTALLEK